MTASDFSESIQAAKKLLQRAQQEAAQRRAKECTLHTKTGEISSLPKQDFAFLAKLQGLCADILEAERQQSTGERLQRLTSACERLFDPCFRIAVVATMSSGKSTLLNTLLGHDLLPARSEATTAKIIRIEACEGMPSFAAKAYNEKGDLLDACEHLTKEVLEQWNTHDEYHRVDIIGEMGWVKHLPREHIVFYDTPGPNAITDPAHKKRLEGFLFQEHQEFPDLILYLLDATRLSVQDDHTLLLQVIAHLKKQDPFFEERCMFLLNKFDEIDPERDGSVEEVLERTKRYLKQFMSIDVPVIVPISAKAALLSMLVRSGQPLTKKQKAALFHLDRHLPNQADALPLLQRLSLGLTADREQRAGHRLFLRSGLHSFLSILSEALAHIAQPLRLYRALRALVDCGLLAIPLTKQHARDLQHIESALQKAWSQRKSPLSPPTHRTPQPQKERPHTDKTTPLDTIPQVPAQKQTQTEQSEENTMSIPRVKLTYNPLSQECWTTVDEKEDNTLRETYSGKGSLQTWFDSYMEQIHDRLNEQQLSFVFHGTRQDAVHVEETLKLREETKDNRYQFSTDLIEADYESLRQDFLQLLQRLEEEVLQGHQESIQGAEKEVIDNIRSLLDLKTFQVAVIACVSSGKSTMLNALLGQEILPARNEATTAKVLYILDDKTAQTPNGWWFDKEGKEIAHESSVSKERLDELNKAEDVSKIRLHIDIPWTRAESLAQVELMDTPGPNNASDQEHKVITYNVVELSERSPDIVLYVMDYRKMEVNDDRDLLKKVSSAIQKGGTQANDRILFVLNCIDELDEDKEKTTTRKAIEKAKAYLQKQFGIQYPRIFPLSALSALLFQMRKTSQPLSKKQASQLRNFEDTLQSFSEMNEAALCPAGIRLAAEQAAQQEGADSLLARSGILLLQEAIWQYFEAYYLPLRLHRFYTETQQKLMHEEKNNQFEQEILRADRDVEQMNRDLNKIQEILRDSQIVSEIDNSLKQKQKEFSRMLFHEITNFETQTVKFLSDFQGQISNTSYQGIKMATVSLEQRVSNIAASTESEVRARLEELMLVVQQEVIRLFEKKLQALLKTDELKSIQLPDLQQWSSSFRLSLEKNVEESEEEKYVTQQQTRTVKKERAWYNPKKWLSMFDSEWNYYEQEETFEVAVAIMEVNQERLRQSIQSALTEQSREMRKSAQTFLEEKMLLFRRRVETLIKSVEGRIQEKVGELQSKLQKKEEREQEKQLVEKRLRRFRSLANELEQKASLGLRR